MLKQALRGRPLRAVMAAVTVSTALVVGSFGATSGAAPQTKALSASCSGVDEASQSLIGLLGGSLTLPFSVTSDVPTQLQPNESGSPISFLWSVQLGTDLVDKAVGIDPTITVTNVAIDMGVSGPTSTKVVEGRPANFDVNLVKGQPAQFDLGPYSGTLQDVGKGGVIRYAPSKIALSINLDLNGKTQTVSVDCKASGIAATTTVKIPGSPDIVQPITVEAQPGQTVTVDVLGQYVTPGTDEKGNTLPVDPTSLKVVDGPATVTPNNQLAITAGAAGTTTSATFEVCSGTLPGANEVQRLVIDPSNDAMRRTVGFTLKQGDAETAPVWLAKKWIEFPQEGGNLIGNLFNAIYLDQARQYHPELVGQPYPAVYPKPVDWRGESFGFFFTDRFVPSADQIKAALESLPGIGTNGVEVAAVADQPFSFDITFVNQNGQKDVPEVTVGAAYTILPRETLDLIIKTVSDLQPSEPTPPPDGFATNLDYANYLRDQINAAIAAGDLAKAQENLNLLVPLLPGLIFENIDIQGVIKFINGLFPSPPTTSTLVPGEDPTPICSQGIVDVTTAAVAGTTATPAADTGATVAAEIKFAG